MESERKRLEAENELHKYLVDNCEEYAKQIGQYSREEKEIVGLQSENIKIEKEKKELEYALGKLKSEVEDKNKNILANERKLKTIRDNIRENDVISKKIEKIGCSINWREKLVELRTNKANYFNDNISELKLFLEGKIKREYINNDLANIFKALVDKYLSKIDQLEKEVLFIHGQINDKQKEYNDYIEVDKKISSIIQEGKKLIMDNKLSECPLCHAKYPSFENLLEKISNTLEESLKLKQLNNDISNFNVLYKKKLAEQQAAQEVVKKIVEELVEQFENDYNNQNKRIQKLKREISTLRNELKEKETIKERIIDELGNIDIRNVDLNKLQEDNDKSIVLLKNEIVNLEKQIKEMSLQEVECDKKLKDNSILILDKQDSGMKIKNNDIVLRFKEILSLLKVNEINNDFEQLMMEIEEKYKRDQCNINDIKEKIEVIKDKHNETMQFVITKKEQYGNKLQELRRKQGQYIYECKSLFQLKRGFASDFSRIGRLILKFKDGIKGELECKNVECINDISRINDSINLIEDINIDISKLMKQQVWCQKKKDNESLELELTKIEKKKQEIEKCRTMCEEYISKKINEFFDSKTINQIYSKIDPHPRLTHIKFSPELTKKKQGIHIYAYDEKEENSVAPVLYLSSAQVNILSLSIFLAKVLTEDNIGLDTIFIDDPIQHLDGINILSFIDLLRCIITSLNRQIIISTHNETFYKLIKMKMDSKYYASKFIELKQMS